MATSQKGENPVKIPDQPHPQPPSDPPSNNNAAPSTRQQPHTDLSRQDGDQSKTLETGGAAAGSTAVKDSKDEPVSNIQRKIRRAERFGMPVQLSEEEKRNSRAERFGSGSGSGSGSTVHGSDALKKSEEQKRKARAERFGLVQSEPVDEDAKKKARLARFGAVPNIDPLEEDKKKARAIRFSQPTSGSVSQVNGKGNNIEMKTAIAGKAGGAT